MPNTPATRVRPWQATVILTLFFFAVAGAAAIGWWYARESPAHQGPIVLISVDRMAAPKAQAAAAQAATTPPAMDALAADSVVFERAYTHSPQTLPAHASLLSGQLPPDHGVRDDVGFTLREDVRTLAEQLRSRGFNTGAAVSSFLLRAESGVAQGFAFFDAEMPEGDDEGAPALEREARSTVDAAERWLQTQNGQRFFLFVQLDQPDADTAITRLTQLLKERRLYDKATIVLVGERGPTASELSLDEASLHVPLLVKQPDSLGAGRRVSAPVQHIDVVPTSSTSCARRCRAACAAARCAASSTMRMPRCRTSRSTRRRWPRSSASAARRSSPRATATSGWCAAAATTTSRR